MKATDAQLAFIEEIQDHVKEKFSGSTKEDARLYIGRNIEAYKLQSSSSWVLEKGYC